MGYDTGGSQFIATANGRLNAITDATADAMNCVPPVRKHPSRNSVMTYLDNRSIILFVTVVSEKRRPILANPQMHKIIVDAWGKADSWAVGRYVIMPDHIHFFCAPRNWEGDGFHRWMKQWKSLAALAYHRSGGSQFIATANGRFGETADAMTDAMNCVPPATTDAMNCVPPATTDAMNCVPPATTDAMNCVPPAGNPPLFQRDCWDRQLRTGESYSGKWEYVRNNPVRKGLVADADDWLYQGEICQFVWHERI